MKTGKNSCLVFGIITLLIAISIANISAITGSIGNARMIIKAEIGETVERSILVKNVNNIELRIEALASGDLEKYTTIVDNNFTLKPGEDKKINVKIIAKKQGTTETKINIKFIPLDENEKGVGLSSTIIITAGEGEENEEIEQENEEETESNNEEGGSITGNFLNIPLKYTLAGALTIIMLLLLIILLVIASKKSKQEKIQKINEIKEGEALDKNDLVKIEGKNKPKKKVKKL